MNARFSDTPDPRNARDFVNAIHQQFLEITKFDDNQVVAAFQSANLYERTTNSPDVMWRCVAVKEAAIARMSVLVADAESSRDRKRLRKKFLAATGRIRFWRPFDLF